MAVTSHSFHCMRCRTVLSLACVGMSQKCWVGQIRGPWSTFYKRNMTDELVRSVFEATLTAVVVAVRHRRPTTDILVLSRGGEQRSRRDATSDSIFHLRLSAPLYNKSILFVLDAHGMTSYLSNLNLCPSDLSAALVCQFTSPRQVTFAALNYFCENASHFVLTYVITPPASAEKSRRNHDWFENLDPFGINVENAEPPPFQAVLDRNRWRGRWLRKKTAKRVREYQWFSRSNICVCVCVISELLTHLLRNSMGLYVIYSGPTQVYTLAVYEMKQNSHQKTNTFTNKVSSSTSYTSVTNRKSVRVLRPIQLISAAAH